MFMTSGLLLCLLWCAVDIVAVNRGFGLNTKQGAHNRTNFMAELNSRGGRVKSETQIDIEGIKGNPLPNDSSVYLVDMKKPIGTKGETKVRIVVQKGTNKIISAYPQK